MGLTPIDSRYRPAPNPTAIMGGLSLPFTATLRIFRQEAPKRIPATPTALVDFFPLNSCGAGGVRVTCIRSTRCAVAGEPQGREPGGGVGLPRVLAFPLLLIGWGCCGGVGGW